MTYQDNRSDFDGCENIYLSKILLFSKDIHKVAEKLKHLSDSAISTNSLNSIGMYPLIARINTPLGKICISIWLISNESRFEQFRLGYYSGASHSILYCNTKSDFENISDIYSMTPTGIPTTIVKRSTKKETRDQSLHFILPENILESERPIYYHSISKINKLNEIFSEIGQKIAEDIASGEYHTFSPQLVNQTKIYKLMNKRSFEKVQDIVGSLGYKLNEDGIIKIPTEMFVFDIDFYRNQVKATISTCINCEKKCKHSRRLCVVEETQGYSNQIIFDNLRALAILYYIHDGKFNDLEGTHRREDIDYQLNRLKNSFYKNCLYEKEEKKYQQIHFER